ncbi:MAG: RNA polymerase sigma factor [Gammaproteobacteria bacterium]|nr:RNA polymerase sigma factor [Gammaproteobacteria bacterium]
MLEAVLKSPGVPTQAEFHEVIATRADRWYSACLRITRDEGLAEDAVQDALLNAWNKRHQFDRGARLDTWIHRIAINAALQILRRKKPQSWEPLEHEIADDAARPEDAHSAEELGEQLADALCQLSDIERVCFVLKHLEQWRLKEIAEELGTNVGTIKQALFRALKKLRVSMASLRSEQ